MTKTLLNLKNRFSIEARNVLPLVILLLVIHLILWSGLTGISHSAPDWDNMEELVWGDSLQWGYYKHPPLPSWIMHGMISIFGHPVWLTFFTGQLSVVLALFFMWKLGGEFSFQSAHEAKHKAKQGKVALIAILLTSLITYFTVRGVMNNHNTMQLWSIAGAMWMLYRAARDQKLSDWAWLGVFCGFAMLTKYSALIQFFCFFLYLGLAGKLKQKATWIGIALALVIFSILMAPHLYWLSQQSVGPMSYASHSINKPLTRLEQLHTIQEFLITNVGRIAPFLIALGLLIFWNRNKSKNPVAQETLASQLPASDRLFIVLMGVAPVAFTVLFAILFKAPLAAHWATTFFLLFGFFSWWWISTQNEARALRRTIIIVLILQIISSVGYALVRGPLSQATGRATRSTYPGPEVSNKLLSIWKAHSTSPLVLVAGDTWTAGNVVMHAPSVIPVLIDGDFNSSPWVAPKKASLCGMLVVIDRSPETVGDDPIPEKLSELMALASQKGHLTLAWTKQANGPKVEIDWGIIPAVEGCQK